MSENSQKKRSVGRPRLIQKIDPLPKLGIVNNPNNDNNLVELSYDNVSIFKKLFSLLKLMNVKEINIQFHSNYTKILGDSVTVGKYWDKKISGLFVDTFHIKEQVLCELYFWYPHVEEGGFIAFHDTNWPEGKHDVYDGIVWDRVEEGVKSFFNVDSLKLYRLSLT